MTHYLTITAMWELPEPNVSGALYGPTAGIARNMQWELSPAGEKLSAPVAQGGGDLNGSANTAHMLGQAGTNARQVPRAL